MRDILQQGMSRMPYVQVRTGAIHDRVNIHRKGFFAPRANNGRDAVLMFVGCEYPPRGDGQFSIPKKFIDDSGNPVGHAMPMNVPDCPQMPQELSALADGPAMPQGCYRRPRCVEHALPWNGALLRLTAIDPEKMQCLPWGKRRIQKGRPMSARSMRLGQQAMARH